MISNSKARIALQLCIIFLPWSIRRPILQRAFGWHLDPKARIGLSIVDVDDLHMAADALIGSLNVVIRLNSLQMAERAVIAKYNWVRVGSFAALTEAEAPGFLKMETDSFFTMMHFVDCSGGMTMGYGSGFGGARSVVFGHYLDPVELRQQTRPVTIGANTILAAHVTVTPGAAVAEGCLVGAGAVVTGRLNEPGMLYAGSPAKPIRELPEQYVNRTHRDFS